MRSLVTTTLLAGALVLAACGDDSAQLTEEQQEVLADLATQGFDLDDFGNDGVLLPHSSGIFDPGLSLAPATDTVILPRWWGRLRGRPVDRASDVVITGDTAVVTRSVSWNGRFLVNFTTDSLRAPTWKPLAETAVQQAVLVRLPVESLATDSVRWRLVRLSPQEFRATDEARRTVRITRVVVKVNGEVRLDVTDPAHLYAFNAGIPRLSIGDSVEVTAEVDNSSTADLFPRTFLFIHILHADPLGVIWRRFPMRREGGAGFAQNWRVRRPGRERIVVDAIDAGAFRSDGEYRSNVWAIPYRIE